MKTIHIITVLAATITGYATAANRAILPHTKLYDEMNNNDNKITSPTHSFVPNNNDDNQYEEAVVNVATIAQNTNTAYRHLKSLLDMKKGKSNEGRKSMGEDDVDAKILTIKGYILLFTAELGLKDYLEIEVGDKVFNKLFYDELEKLEEGNNGIMVGLELLVGDNSRRQLQLGFGFLRWRFYRQVGIGLTQGLSFGEVVAIDYLSSTAGFTQDEITRIYNFLGLSLPVTPVTPSPTTGKSALVLFHMLIRVFMATSFGLSLPLLIAFATYMYTNVLIASLLSS